MSFDQPRTSTVRKKKMLKKTKREKRNKGRIREKERSGIRRR